MTPNRPADLARVAAQLGDALRGEPIAEEAAQWLAWQADRHGDLTDEVTAHRRLLWVALAATSDDEIPAAIGIRLLDLLTEVEPTHLADVIREADEGGRPAAAGGDEGHADPAPPESTPAAPAADSVPATLGFFSVDVDGTCDLHATAEAAIAAAESTLEWARDQASDGWPEEIERVCWGQVLGRVVEVERRDLIAEAEAEAAAEGLTLEQWGRPEFDFWADYALVPVAR